MIVFQRSVRIAAGKGHEALELHRKLTEHLRKRDPKNNWRLLVEAIGDHSVHHWTAEFASLAEWDALPGKNEADREFQAMGAESRAAGIVVSEGNASKAYRVVVG